MSINLHVTGEIGKYTLGGIGTVLNLINDFLNKDTNEILFVHKSIPGRQVTDLPDSVKRVEIENINEYLNASKFDQIIFHNLDAAFQYLQNPLFNFKNAYYVVHSNPIIEQGYKFNNLSNHQINMFIGIMKAFNLISISYYEKQLIEKIAYTYDIKINPIKVIYNGILLEDVTQNKSASNIVKSFGYIGRIDYRKGLTFLYDYWKLINSNLLIAAGGLNRFSNEVILELCNYQASNIIHLGYCEKERKVNFFNNIEALIVPSLYEPFGMVILESIQYNKIVLCNKTGGIVEILGEDYPFYFDIYNKYSFYQCMERFNCCTNTDKETILIEMKKRVKDRFSVENMIYAYENIASI